MTREDPMAPGEAFADPRARVPYSPIGSRPPLRWPDNARVAFWVSPNVEHYEYLPPPDQGFNHFPRVAPPDVQQYALRDYGNRVGFWRMTEILDRYGVRATVSLNLGVLDHYPEISAAMQERDWAFMSHGIYNTRVVYDYSEEEERAFFADTSESLLKHTKKPLKGMLGPALSATTRTPDLMAEYGLIYSADWPLDDQPVPILCEGGHRLVSVPYSYDLNDGNPGLAFNLETLAAQAKAHFDRLWAEGAASGRVMCLALHPFAIGQPQMIGYLADILEHVMSHDQVWMTTADDIAEYYIEHFYDEQLDAARSLG
jgi:allantoinase